jgi:molybdenum cofactor biosynthesis protein MoaC
MKERLSHVDTDGNARMVNVGDKAVTRRIAVCAGTVKMLSETVSAIVDGKTTKGNVLTTAKVAGIMAAKNTAGLIPMCHNIPISEVEIVFEIKEDCIGIIATVEAEAKTGVEMEAMTAVSVAAMTIYDMAKAIDRGMVISNIRLVKKSGGKSGDYIRREK